MQNVFHELPDFYSLEDKLLRLDAGFSAAELQGATTAVLIIQPQYTFAKWLIQMVPEAQEDQTCYDELMSLWEATRWSLNTERLNFDLFLPDEDEPLNTRVEALQWWCQGFAYGLALSGLSSMQSLPTDSREWTQDVIKIGAAGAADLSEEEASENALLELVEFVRVGVLMMNEELQPVRGRTYVGENDA